MYILYILTGALCYFIGYASATYYTRNIRQDYHDLKYEHTRFIDELVKLNQERLEYKSIADRFEEKRFKETRKHDLGIRANRLEAKMQHYLTENKGLIRKNKQLKKKNKQLKKQLKETKDTLKINPDQRLKKMRIKDFNRLIKEEKIPDDTIYYLTYNSGVNQCIVDHWEYKDNEVIIYTQISKAKCTIKDYHNFIKNHIIPEDTAIYVENPYNGEKESLGNWKYDRETGRLESALY